MNGPEGLDLQAQRWQRTKELLAQALELHGDARAAFLAGACSADEALSGELLSLIAAAEADHDALEAPPAELMLHALEDRANRAWLGRRIGAYRVTALIARGGMGEIYRAERDDGQYRHSVAIKLMRESLRAAPQAAARFRAEQQILVSLDHPNLAKVFDGGLTEEGTPYFVMEHVAGVPIDQHCEQLQLPTAQRLRLFRSVCQVVHYAHQKGVVHRDLKAANILVTADGTIKLVDFGIAKRIGPDESQPDSTRTATVMRAMTLAYASPEQVRGADVTPASDIYSLGVVLYRLLTGTSPYPAATTTSDYELARAICDTEPAPPSRSTPPPDAAPGGMRPRLHADLDAVVLMALRKDPAHRYASAEHLADDVFRFLEHLPVQARRGAWGYRASRFVLRHRIAVTAAVLANLALLAGLATAAWQSVEANRQRERAEQHLGEVRRLANVLIFDVYEAITPLPGSTPARELVVRNALGYLRQALAQPSADPAQRVEIARGFINVGDMQGRYGYPNLGAFEGALTSYGTALGLLEPLVEPSAGTPAEAFGSARRELAKAYQHQGALLSMLGRNDQAEAMLRKGVAVAAAVRDDAPRDLKAQDQLATLNGQLSDVLTLLGQHEAAAQALDTAVQLLEAIVAQDPDNVDAGQSLSTGYIRRGDVFLDRDPTEASARRALVDYQQAHQVLERLAARHPDNSFVIRHVATVQQFLGEAQLRLGDAQKAVEAYRAGLAIIEQLIRKDPADLQFKADAAKMHIKLSEALAQQGQAQASVDAARTAVDQIDSLPASALANTLILFHKGQAYYRLGVALERRAALPAAEPNDRGEACERYRQSLPIIEDIHTRLPAARIGLPATEVRQALERCKT